MQSETIVSRVRPIFKYLYLMTFFALLAGFFHPLIVGRGYDATALGIVTLFIGTAGGVLLYRSGDSKHQSVLMGTGFALIGVSLYMIYTITGRI